MTCIKTGARVKFLEYGVVHPADLYAVGDCIVIRTNPNIPFHEGIRGTTEVTHSAVIGQGFARQSEGIFVVPRSQIVAVVPMINPDLTCKERDDDARVVSLKQEINRD